MVTNALFKLKCCRHGMKTVEKEANFLSVSPVIRKKIKLPLSFLNIWQIAKKVNNLYFAIRLAEVE